jgi:hypothetical protein
MAEASLGLFTKPYIAYQKDRLTLVGPSGSLFTGGSSVSSNLTSSTSRGDFSIHQMPRGEKIETDNITSESNMNATFYSFPNSKFEPGEDSTEKSNRDDSNYFVENSTQLDQARNTVHSSKSETRTALGIAGDMAAASGKSFGHLFTTYTKGALVDMPLAAAEGLRVVPRMYGEKLRNHGNITDWKSGFTVAGKTFRYGMCEGLTDVFVLPYRGNKKNGTLGIVTGVGKGVVSLATKTSSAAIGLLAYPADGISRSIQYSFMRGTRDCIKKAKLTEGEWIIESQAGRTADRAVVLSAFDRMKKGQGEAK